MPFYLFELQTTDPKHSKFNGRVAIGLDWGTNHDEPFTEKEIIITHLFADKNPQFIHNPPVLSNDTNGNYIRFHHYSWFQTFTFKTDGMVRFTERTPIPRPISRWNKNGERKTYRYLAGRWVHDGWETKEEG